MSNIVTNFGLFVSFKIVYFQSRIDLANNYTTVRAWVPASLGESTLGQSYVRKIALDEKRKIA